MSSNYQNGLLVQICIVSVGIAFGILQELVYHVHNKRAASGGSKRYVL